MKQHLPNVRGNKLWIVFIVIVIVAFFGIWSLGGGNTPAALEGDQTAPIVDGQ